MSSSSEVDQSEEQGTRPGFVRAVWQALSSSRIPTTEETDAMSPAPTFGEQDAGVADRKFVPVEAAGFSEEQVTDSTKIDEIHPRESPLRFYSDRQLGRELDPEAGMLAFGLTERNSRAFSSPLHRQPAVGFVSGRELAFSDPTSSLAARGISEPDFSQEIPRQFSSALYERRVPSEDPSPRLGRNDEGNVTQRNTKRPKERSRDKAYKQRFSMGSSGGMDGLPNPAFFVSGRTGQDQVASASRSIPGHPSGSGSSWEEGYVRAPTIMKAQVRGRQPSEPRFEISLTYAGTSVLHQVWDTMPIHQLLTEACSIFALDPADVVLVLFSGQPTSLPRDGRISGPPRVAPGSTVMVCCVPGMLAVERARGNHGLSRQPPYLEVPAISSKLLGTFKLPKFDGAARSWKAWEKSFQRFLGIHQLDHVLEEDFLDTLWSAPGAKAANKMVYFLVEDAVGTGTLASKLVRQATKWNGHEAFFVLRNGYVFNGPQTATILLAELSNIRLLRDEDASTFCLRLVELIEDLELIPGDSAVYLTDIQKLGYLLSAIRHEKSLQAVYSQLQSEQLRGTVSFDQACRELHHRVEAMRADEFLDSRPGRALISTQGKKNGQQALQVQKVACLAKDCVELVQPYLPLCKLCYLQCMAGKVPTLALRDNLGNAVFNSQTKKLDFPAAVPQSRFPKKGLKNGKKVLMTNVATSPLVSDSVDTQN